ncbi:MAG: peptidase S16 [Gammaproteobacteria bacterium]|nr:MAG: peptidase S16 [Gammaproteobacteria bacterium]
MGNRASTPSGSATLPLFPLRTVLFPGGPLPLRVFEPRYLDMISACLRQDSEFGVILLRDGSETGVARLVEVGTCARITDWYQGSDGILGITAVGGGRFRLREVSQQADGLYVGDVLRLPPLPPVPLPEEYRSMAALLRTIIDDLGKLYEPLPRAYEDAAWVGARFAEILPMELEDKQRCLEIDDPLELLRVVRPLLQSIRRERPQ